MRSLRTLVAAAVVIVVAIPAGAAPPETETVHEHGATDTFIDVAPACESGPAYEISLIYNLVEHVTEFDDGRVHETFTQTGTFVAEPLDPELPAARGRFTIWGGFNQNNQSVNGTFTFNVIGRFEDGTKINTHIVDHFNVTPTGAEFFFSHCHD